ncbi:hypothetical protein O3M35_006452 [Rhynocoris fuscipes]|uniref:Peptidase S1 domain-containing protein n=2 Tax=Rhynocoris fuscipes TaxID=488301 RepID=A0AAW1DE36_9HEMI
MFQYNNLLILLIINIILFCNCQDVNDENNEQKECFCVPYFQCDEKTGTIMTTGEGQTNVKVKECTGAVEVCCLLHDNAALNQTVSSPTDNGNNNIGDRNSIIGSSIPLVSPVQGSGRNRSPADGEQKECVCVPYYQCDEKSGTVITNAKVTSCTGAVEVCCLFNDSSALNQTDGRNPIDNGNNNIGDRNPITMEPPVTVTTNPITNPGTNTGPLPSPGQGSDQKECVCVPFYQCDEKTGTVITTGDGLIDIKQTVCTGATEVCCVLNDDATLNQTVTPPNGNNRNPITEEPPITVTPTPITDPDTNTSPSLPFVSAGIGCGRKRFPVDGDSFYANKQNIAMKIAGLLNMPEETFYGEAPWMVRLIPSINGQINDSYVMCGGVLITPTVVLTGAHCVYNLTAESIIVRIGDWNINEAIEPIAPQDRQVSRVIIHPNFNSKNLANDVAILGLEQPAVMSAVVDTICTPDAQNPVNGSACIATGWGKTDLSKRGIFPDTLRKVNLPLMDRTECVERLRKTRLGKYFILLPGFLCAGGVPDSDTCRGDGGGPLYCPLQSDPNRYAVVGLVAWGIECGKGNPAVFADVREYMPWIKEQIFKNFD